MVSVAAAVLTIIADLPLLPVAVSRGDWLLTQTANKAGVYRTQKADEVVLSNGLISRTFRSGTTARFDHVQSGEAFVRSVKPEAEIVVDGKTYSVGGLSGQPNQAFLRSDWLDQMKPTPGSLQLESLSVGKTSAPNEWKRVRHAEAREWPAPGASLTLSYGSASLPGVKVSIRYELYDNAPFLCKSLHVTNQSGHAVQLNKFSSEILGVVEGDSYVDAQDHWRQPNMTVISEYAFGGGNNSVHARTINWVTDPDYSTQVNYDRTTPCVLKVAPPIGPDQPIAPGATFDSFRVFEILHDSTERERKSLEVRRFYRMMSPWVTENPLMLHLTSTKLETAKKAIDQAAECGFEMVILSFGSGVNMEDASPANVARFKELHDYAAKQGLELGGYSLLASRRIDDTNDIINPATGKTGGSIFGNSPCIGSEWGQNYFKHLRSFLEGTGFNLLEHDGNYPGDICASTMHPGHKGTDDSQWNQWVVMRDFYRECRAKGIYLNVPDWYFLVGSNKTGMGYRETNWSLPRDQQHIHARQNLFDGTWEKTPTMGWMMTPLVEYQGGGAAATIEPLKEHLADYEQHLMNNLGYGAQSCYRGPRLYDSPETKAMVIKAVQWFKKYRDILESDVVHVRRPDGQRLDAVLHVNPTLPIKGMLLVYNPSAVALRETLRVPLYYTGLSGKCQVSVEGGQGRTMKLSDKREVECEVSVPAGSRTWVIFR